MGDSPKPRRTVDELVEGLAARRAELATGPAKTVRDAQREQARTLAKAWAPTFQVPKLPAFPKARVDPSVMEGIRKANLAKRRREEAALIAQRQSAEELSEMHKLLSMAEERTAAANAGRAKDRADDKRHRWITYGLSGASLAVSIAVACVAIF